MNIDSYGVIYSDDYSRLIKCTNKSIKNCIIHSGVKVIENQAFQDCKHLSSLSFPESLAEIRYGAFKNCSSLTTLLLPDSIKEMGDNINDGVFENCSSLKNVVLPQKIKWISHRLFCGCSELEAIILPNSVSNIWVDAFSCCRSLKRIVFPSELKTISCRAFRNCFSLKDIQLPNSIEQIDTSAFEGCDALSSINIPAQISNPLYGNFFYLESIKSVYYTKESTYTSFDGLICNKTLSEIYFIPPAKEILSIPSSVKYIAQEAIEYANPVQIKVDYYNSSFSSVDDVLFNKDRSVLLRYATAGKTLKLSLSKDVRHKYTIPKEVKRIQLGAFRNAIHLEEIVIPDTVSEIGDDSFEGCTSLKRIILPKTLKTISRGMFDGCTSLETIVIPESVLELGDFAFSNCVSLKRLTLPKYLKTISQRYPFWDCTSLESIDIDDSNLYFKSSDGILFNKDETQIIAFPQSYKRRVYNVPKTVISLHNRLFHGCVHLEEVIMPPSITKIGSILCNCISLQRVFFPRSVHSIDVNALYGCLQLKYVHFSNIIQIEDDSLYGNGRLFYKCNKLSMISVPDDLVGFFRELLPYHEDIIVGDSSDSIYLEHKAIKDGCYIFFDTETTGLPRDFNAPSNNTNNWPRLVQLSWILTDVKGTIIREENHIVYPDGFTIPRSSSAVNGITLEIAQTKGEHIGDILELFTNDLRNCRQLVGHNLVFDKRVIGAEMIRLGHPDIMNNYPSVDTMMETIDFCHIEDLYGRRNKYPKLSELYNILFDETFADVHNALSDTRATMRCFWRLKELGVINEGV